MLKSFKHFLKSENGSYTPLFAISMVPLFAVLGVSADYTSGVQTRSNMQNALDAATLAITMLPIDSTLAQRQDKLQAFYAANGADGTATLNSFTVDNIGTAKVDTSASYSMPTNFMRVAAINNVTINVNSSATKPPALVQATFNVTKVSGWWDKTVSLFGTPYGSTNPPLMLMKITYTYNKGGDPKGYGTTTISVPNLNGVFQAVQTQTCTTTSTTNNPPAGAIINGNKMTTCSITLDTTGGKGAAIDVTKMDTLFLQMDVPQGNPTKVRSDDPTTSNRLYIDGVEVATGTKVNIFNAVPCGQTSQQAWEDGGSPVPAPIVNADFFYSVTGKCAFSQRPSGTTLTQ